MNNGRNVPPCSKHLYSMNKHILLSDIIVDQAKYRIAQRRVGTELSQQHHASRTGTINENSFTSILEQLSSKSFIVQTQNETQTSGQQKRKQKIDDKNRAGNTAIEDEYSYQCETQGCEEIHE